jgi:hypothetical protein
MMSATSTIKPDVAAAALTYAQRKLAVFPVWNVVPFRDGLMCGCGRLDCGDPGKHPLGMLAKNGVSDAATDVDRVRHWWRMKPDANIAIECSGLVVLDVDPRHGGDASLTALEDRHDVLPATWTVRSGSGGRHLYFAAPDGVAIKNNNDGGLARGIDIRTAHGYVLAPPSRHISGSLYTWLVDPDEVALAPLPEWLVELLSKPKATAPEEWRQLVSDGPAAGSRARQQAIASFAGHLLRRFIDPKVTLDLIQCWNAQRCDPPLDVNEVTRIVEAIAGRERSRRGQ